ncbi:hypothetical protein AB0I69_08605 [Streptomyces sp. NPDC050508]|uniref:hypothetical protein n=1 Tax=Streptomyces sp. NPDC050508 TaxID=3155405 RepID=UPI00343D7465
MAELATQIVPVASALAGVAVSLIGNIYLERGKWQRTRSAEQEALALQSYADLLQAVTDIARTLRQTAEHLDEGNSVDMLEVAAVLEDLIGQLRRQSTMTRLVGPRNAFHMVRSLEEQVEPIYRLLSEVARSGESFALVAPARRLLRTRDEIIDHLREAGGLS